MKENCKLSLRIKKESEKKGAEGAKKKTTELKIDLLYKFFILNTLFNFYLIFFCVCRLEKDKK